MNNMKNKYLLLFFFLFAQLGVALAQEDSTQEATEEVTEEAAADEKPELSLQLGFHTLNNKLPYLMLSSKLRKDNSFQVITGAKVKVYFKEETDEGLIGEAVTDSRGVAKLVLPARMKAAWDSSTTYPFVAVAAETRDWVETRSEIEITKAKILMDTTQTEEGKRAISVQVLQFDGTEWTPAPDVELKVGVRRLSSLLPVGEEETYTTDSAGMVIAEFGRDSLPTADKKGNLVLAVKVEDNDMFGNMEVEMAAPWGVYTHTPAVASFGKRTLWATSDRAPLWLLFMAAFIIVAVWSVIIYLIYLIFRLKKLGNKSTVEVGQEAPVFAELRES